MYERESIANGDAAIGNRVRKLRERKSLTQKKLADLVMVSSSSITRLESGKSMVSVFTIKRVAKVLNVSVADILEGDETTTSELSTLSKKLNQCPLEQRRNLIRCFEEIVDNFLEINLQGQKSSDSGTK